MDLTNVKSENEDGRPKYTIRRHAMRCEEKYKHAKQLIYMKQQEKIIERNLSSFVNNVKVDSVIAQSISSDHVNACKKRERMFENIFNNVCDVLNELKTVKSIVSNSAEIRKLDVRKYKNRLVNLSRNIQELKSFLSVQTLSEEQFVLDKELKDFSELLERYFSVKHSTTYVALPNSCATKNKNEDGFRLYKEIDNFHKLLAKTGHTENWTDEDHLLFLRTRKKCKTIPALVVAIQTKCPDLSAESIINHEAWYKVYLDLREKQRLQLKEWRAQREADKSRKKASENGDKSEASSSEQTDVSGDIKKYSNGMRSKNHVQSNVVKKKALIENWRRERENKRAMDDEQLKFYLDSRRALEEARRRVRLKEIQEILNVCRAKKCLETSSTESKSHENMKDRSKQDASLMLAFRKQDEEYVRRKIDLIMRARKSRKILSAAFVRRKPISIRPSTTLFNVTKVWSKKCKIGFSSKPLKPEDSLYIKDVPKNCVHWRNEESTDLNARFVFL